MPDLRALIDRLQTLPKGRRVFDLIAKVYVPHTAGMGFRLESLTASEIRVSMPDRRRNRNHLHSLHAMALAHLAEFTSGLLLLYAVAPDGYRTILTSYSIDFLAKARGRVTASATLKRPKGSAAPRRPSRFARNGKGNLDKKNVPVTVEVTDGNGVLVARARAIWRVGKIP